VSNFFKWIGAGLGWFAGGWLGERLGWYVGGPAGSILGFILGTVIDSFEIRLFRKSEEKTTNDFATHLLVVIAAVMRIEKQITKQKLDYVKHFLKHNFGEKEVTAACTLLKDIYNQNIPFNNACAQIRYHLDYSSRLQLSHFLYNLVNTEGRLTASGKKILDAITLELGIQTSNKQAVGSMIVKNAEITAAYETLSVQRSANVFEIKKAYRHLANKYHPDKVEYSDNETKKNAHEKFQQITHAYEVIKKERKFS